MVESHLGGYLGLFHGLVVLNGTQFEVIGFALTWTSDHDGLKLSDRSLRLLFCRVDEPGKSLEVVHLERSAEDYLLETCRS